MAEELLATTEKARILKLGDGSIAKEYSDLAKGNLEWKALCRLSELFPETRVDGWTYTVVRPLNRDRGGRRVRMTAAEGIPFGEAMRADPGLAWHPGVWLGLFHTYAPADEGLVLSYPDYKRDHVFIHQPSRTVTIIDPGVKLGRELAIPERDLIEFSRTMVTALAPRLRAGSLAVRSFFAGYQRATSHIWTTDGLRRGLMDYRKRLPIARPRNSRTWLLADRLVSAILYQYLRWRIIRPGAVV